nr:uncharacterized protein LOC113799928 [Penaeus vannamei]
MASANNLIFLMALSLLRERCQAEVFVEKLVIVADMSRHVLRLEHISLEDQPCQTDEECALHLPNLDTALSIVSSVPSAPYCSDTDETNSTASGRCTCGEGKCVSFTREFGKGTILYYCGPCSHVGAQCEMEDTCQHEMAECRDNYCKCKDNGDFYEFSYCDTPYIGYEVTLEIAITVCIVIAMCLLLASVYSIINVRRLRDLRELARQRRGGRAESESQTRPEDSPPVYDEVVGNLPSYQDALAMVPSSSTVEEILREDVRPADSTAEAAASSRDRGSELDNNAPTPATSREPENETGVAEVHGAGPRLPRTLPTAHTSVAREEGPSEILQERSGAGGGSRPPASEGENDPAVIVSSESHRGIQTRF